MKIEHSRFDSGEILGTRKIVITLDEKKLMRNKNYKIRLYNEIFDLLADIQDDLTEEYAEKNPIRKKLLPGPDTF